MYGTTGGYSNGYQQSSGEKRGGSRGSRGARGLRGQNGFRVPSPPKQKQRPARTEITTPLYGFRHGILSLLCPRWHPRRNDQGCDGCWMWYRHSFNILYSSWCEMGVGI